MDTGLVVLCIAIMAVALQQRSVGIMFVAMMCWLGFAAYMAEQWGIAYAADNTTPTWTSDRMFMWVGIALSVLCVFFVLKFNNWIGRPKIIEVPPEDVFVDEYSDMMDRIGRFRRLKPRRRD